MNLMCFPPSLLYFLGVGSLVSPLEDCFSPPRTTRLLALSLSLSLSPYGTTTTTGPLSLSPLSSLSPFFSSFLLSLPLPCVAIP